MVVKHRRSIGSKVDLSAMRRMYVVCMYVCLYACMYVSVLYIVSIYHPVCMYVCMYVRLNKKGTEHEK